MRHWRPGRGVLYREALGLARNCDRRRTEPERAKQRTIGRALSQPRSQWHVAWKLQPRSALPARLWLRRLQHLGLLQFHRHVTRALRFSERILTGHQNNPRGSNQTHGRSKRASMGLPELHSFPTIPPTYVQPTTPPQKGVGGWALSEDV